LLQPKIEEFLNHCRARNLSQNTIRAYRSDLFEFVELSGGSEITVDQVNRKLIRCVVVQLHDGGSKSVTVRRKLAAVKSFCKWLECEGLLDPNLIGLITGPRRRQELPDVAKHDEIKKLIEGTVMPERERLILELLYGSGLRVAELVGINLEDFREDDLLLVRGKGKKERLVIVGEYAREALRAWLARREGLLRGMGLKTRALFFSVGPHRSAERLDVRSVGRIVKAIAKTSGLDPDRFHPHALRHAFATHLHDNGAPLQAISVLLGHARLSTAALYTRVSIGRMMRTYNAAHPHAQR
jgi:integrase/recombinase XerC